MNLLQRIDRNLYPGCKLPSARERRALLVVSRVAIGKLSAALTAFQLELGPHSANPQIAEALRLATEAQALIGNGE